MQAAIAATESGFWRIASASENDPREGLWISGNHDGQLPHRVRAWEQGWGGREVVSADVTTLEWKETPHAEPLWIGLGVVSPLGGTPEKKGSGNNAQHQDPVPDHPADDDDDAPQQGGDKGEGGGGKKDPEDDIEN